jgi:AcrR family transcriptional regulator
MEPKDGILRAAQVVFARHGFRQTAMAMVAEEAGLSRQALYHHFASKEALFAALVDELQEEAFAAAQKSAAKATGDIAAAITAVMAAYHASLMARVAGSPFAAELVEESSRQCGAAVAAYARKFEKELEALILRFVREGRFALKAGVSAHDLTEMAVVASKGVKMAHAGESEARYARALARMIEVICAGVAAERSSAKSARTVSRTRTARRVAR